MTILEAQAYCQFCDDFLENGEIYKPINGFITGLIANKISEHHSKTRINGIYGHNSFFIKLTSGWVWDVIAHGNKVILDQEISPEDFKFRFD